MTELAFNLTAIGITIVLCVYGAGILWLHTWMRTLERSEGEDGDE